MRNLIGISVVAALLAFTGCDKGKDGGGGGAATSKYPGTEEGAKQLLTDIRKDEGTAKQMTLALKPSTADYQAVFEGDKAAAAEKKYAELWSSGPAIGAKPENTELKLWKATSDDLKAWTADAQANFPGGYQKVGAHLKPGLTWYRWKYTKPGETLGMAFDGLVHVNGHWAWFPKPWRAIGE